MPVVPLAHVMDARPDAALPAAVARLESPGPLEGVRYRLRRGGVSGDYAGHLLASLGARVEPGPELPGTAPALEWARSGAMELTGCPAGAPRLAPGPLAACAAGAAAALECVVGPGFGPPLDGAALLGERAATRGLSRRGTTSPGGSCRLLPAADGWIALNLARPEDVALLHAWLEAPVVGEPWSFVADSVRERGILELVERGRLLGLAVTESRLPTGTPVPWCRLHRIGTRRVRPPGAAPRVLDLSSLWAGPLCTHLLQCGGAQVIKVESVRRPDGARWGPARFHDLLNANKASVALDLDAVAERDRLRQLIERVDIVVESARPRALEQLGIRADELLATVPGLVWVSITGYGREAPLGARVAFGDDAAVAAGLAAATAEPGRPPLFCGDAIADPLTGLHAAVAALAAWRSGGGMRVDLALRDVVAHTLGFAPGTCTAELRRSARGWEVRVGGDSAPVRAPRARRPAVRARTLGADTRGVLEELRIRC